MSALAQHSEKAFRVYEPSLAVIVKNYPQPTRLVINSNANTYLARIRDALQGMRLNGWQSQDFTFADLQPIFRSLRHGGEFIFAPIPGGIYCGPPLTDNGKIQATAEQVLEDLGANEFDARDKKVFSALLLLKQRGYLETPLKFRNVLPEQIELMSAEEFIEFFPAESGEYVMI